MKPFFVVVLLAAAVAGHAGPDADAPDPHANAPRRIRAILRKVADVQEEIAAIRRESMAAYSRSAEGKYDEIVAERKELIEDLEEAIDRETRLPKRKLKLLEKTFEKISARLDRTDSQDAVERLTQEMNKVGGAMQSLRDEIKESERYLDDLEERIDNEPEPSFDPVIGSRLPNLSTAKPDGTRCSVADLGGSKWVLLYLWSFKDERSFHYADDVKRWAAQLDPDGLTVVGLHTDGTRDREALAEFMQRNPLPIPVLNDLKNEAREELGLKELPAIVLVSPEGKVCYTQVGRLSYRSRAKNIAALKEVFAIHRPAPKQEADPR